MTTDEGSILAKTVQPPANGSAILTKQTSSVKSRKSATPKIEKSASHLELASDNEPAPKTTIQGAPPLKIAATAPPPAGAVTSDLSSGPKGTTGAGDKLKALFGDKDQRGYDKTPARPGAFAGVLIGLFCSLVGFAMLAFAMAISRRAEEVADASLPCETEQCHEALKLLDTSGNLTVDPCHDFYDYVCYRWTQNGSFMGEIMENFYSLLDSIIMPGELPYPDAYGSHIFFHTYRACISFMNNSQDTTVLASVLPRLQKHASSLHNIPQRDLIMAIATLSAVNGIDVLFGIGLELYEKNTYPALTSGRSIRKAFEGLPNFESHLEEALAKMVTNAPAKNLVGDILKLDDIVNAAFENDSDTRLLNLSSITEVAREFGQADWSSLFQKHLRVPRAEGFLWTGQNQVENILRVISSNTTSETVRAYLSLQVAAEFLALYFKSRLSSVDTTELETRKTCLKTACRVASHACSYQISRLLGLPPIAEGDTQVLLDAVVDAFSKNQGLVPWIDSRRWVTLIATFRNTTVTLPHRLVRQLTDRSTPVYPNISEWSGDFLNEHLTLMGDHKTASVTYPLPVGMELLAERQIEGAFTFSELLNSVVLSGALISAPVLYSATMPREFNFGTIGSLLAREIAHVITPASSKEWWDERSQEGFREGTECLRQVHSSFNGHSSGWNVATASKLFALTMAARTAMDALLSGAGGIGGAPVPGFQQPQTSTDAMRTFFRRFCLLSCGHDELHLSARSLCMIPLMGMPEFAGAFRCPRGTVMNPNDSCALRLPEQRDLERTRKF
ncbi:hypothetical protein HPB49_016094 [Dermacentor silvarum]|uniref:Uncharacterized protein n=1 Tax=Dermacentor silvarum TaxID=543639 RepID=A0ACB8DEE0_DERSI|nr:uncharacterized protein LOC119440660 [Dermacentor silvarum]KAH7966410.1 hypothetical protein HPB49_016094 [Dermacentor silvarum]